MKSTSTRASPAISMSRPRNTNSGTDSRMRFEVPSSMRLATMVSGTRVVSARYDTVAIPNAKAIGTPSATQTATMTTKKITRLRLPSVASMGWANHRPAPTMRMRASAAAASAGVARSISRAHTITSISTMPTPMAATRKLSEISSAGVVMNDCTST